MPVALISLTLVVMTVAAVQVYKILALNCLVSAYMLSSLYLFGIKQGDLQVRCSALLTPSSSAIDTSSSMVTPLPPYLRLASFSPVQMTLLGLSVAVLFFFVSRAEPLEVLSAERPPSRIFCAQVGTSPDPYPTARNQLLSSWCCPFVSLPILCYRSIPSLCADPPCFVSRCRCACRWCCSSSCT
jgi:hypothetical protein